MAAGTQITDSTSNRKHQSNLITTMPEDDNITNPHIMATLESLMRITLAGFGGALAGISISRRGGLGTAAQQALAKASATTPSSSSNVKRLSRQQRRQAIRSAPPVLRPTIDRELPSAWAVACMAFAGVVEFTRLVSPTTFVSQFVTTPSSLEEGEADNEVTEDSKTILVNNEETIKQYYGTTIIDYMIGGGIAGALFKGSAVRTPAGARIDASIMGSSSISNTATTSSLNAIKSRPLSGILPGAALGLLAGVTIVTMEYAQQQVEETFGEDVVDEETDINEDNVPKNNNDDIPEDIKAMTTEELLASIQSLKSGRDESSNRQDKEVKGEPDTEQITTDKAPDLLYSLGFRPHSSSSSSS